jgi:transcriptional regulator with XRE-family HTH domain
MPNLRMTLGLSQEEFAVMLQTSRSQISMTEKGERHLDSKTKSLYNSLKALVEKIPNEENTAQIGAEVSANFQYEKIDYELAIHANPYYQQKAMKTTEEIIRLKKAMFNLSQLLHMDTFVEKSEWEASTRRALHQQRKNYIDLLRKKLKYDLLIAKTSVIIKFYEDHIASAEPSNSNPETKQL